jgi:hypothetical protein
LFVTISGRLSFFSSDGDPEPAHKKFLAISRI